MSPGRDSETHGQKPVRVYPKARQYQTGPDKVKPPNTRALGAVTAEPCHLASGYATKSGLSRAAELLCISTAVPFETV